MSKKISLNPKYTNNSGNSWSTTTYNGLEYHISTNKYHSTNSSLKCEFTTPYDNIDIVVEIGSSSENNYDWCYVGKLDNSSTSYDSNYLDRISGRQSNNNPLFKKVTINVAKAGTHFLIIGYRKDGSGSYGNDCGYFRLVTTEVDSMEPTKYIYCGTKTTVVSEEPIKFTKTNVSYGSEGQRNWSEYQGSNKDYLWETSTGDSGYKTAKISFTTLSDNTIVTLKYNVYWRFTDEKFTVSELDSTKSFISEYGPCSKKVTKEITVPKAGKHFITIGYESNHFNGTYAYVGFSGTNVVTNTRTLVPESILMNNRNIDEVYVGSELIWNKSTEMWCNVPYLYNITWKDQLKNGQRISYEKMTYDKFDNSKTIIPGGTEYWIKTYYGFNVKDFIKNGYLYLYNYDQSIDMSIIPNPVDMTARHTANNCALKCKYLKINTKLKKETTSLAKTFEFFGADVTTETNIHFPVFDEPLIYEHKACNIVGLDKLNTDNITNMDSMFHRGRVVGNLDFSNWNTSKVTNMSYMFYGSKGKNRCKYSNKYRLENYSYLTGLNNWNLQSVNDMHYMFYNSTYYDFQDKELTWNTSNVTDMSYMFAICNAYNFPKLSFDTRNVTNMSYMFRKFVSYNDLKLNFTDTSKVTDMSCMFGFGDSNDYPQYINEYNFSYLNYHGDADISCLDTSNVVNAHDMFYGCKYITPDMIKNIRLPKATNIRNMFRYAYMGGWDFVNNKIAYINTIDLSSFDLGSIPSFDSMTKAFAFGGARIWNNDDEGIGTYIGNLILDNWKCFQSYTNHDFTLPKGVAPFYGCHVTYCYMRGCNDNTKIVLKKMLDLNSTYSVASCSYFIED